MQNACFLLLDRLHFSTQENAFAASAPSPQLQRCEYKIASLIFTLQFMTFPIQALLGGIAFGLLAIYLLAPMASSILRRLKQQWAREVDAYLYSEQHCSPPKDDNLPATARLCLGATSAILGSAILAQYGLTIEGLGVGLYFASVLLLATINIQSRLLPDIIVFPSLWLGLLYHAYTGMSTEHIYGAVAAYLIPYLLVTFLQRAQERRLMGNGDFKAMAMAGAWLGLNALPTFITGFAIGLALWSLIQLCLHKTFRLQVSTGPAHLSGAIAATFGTQISQLF